MYGDILAMRNTTAKSVSENTAEYETSEDVADHKGRPQGLY